MTKKYVNSLARSQIVVSNKCIYFQVIKFIDASATEPLEITAVDRGILELKTVVANLDKQIERIQRKMDEYVPH